MKKLVVMLCVLVFSITQSALAFDGEILFRDIPWGTDIVTFQELIHEDIAPLRDDLDDFSKQVILKFELVEKTNISYLDGSLVEKGEEQPYETYFIKSSENENSGLTFYECRVEAHDDVLIAGYPVSEVRGYAVNSVEDGVLFCEAERSKLVKCSYYFDGESVPDTTQTFQNLMEKLEKVYGEYNLSIIDSSYNVPWKWIWFGTNNTYVCLSSSSNVPSDEWYYGSILNIEYGVTNVGDMIEMCLHPEITAFEETEHTEELIVINPNDTSGL